MNASPQKLPCRFASYGERFSTMYGGAVLAAPRLLSSALPLTATLLPAFSTSTVSTPLTVQPVMESAPSTTSPMPWPLPVSVHRCRLALCTGRPSVLLNRKALSVAARLPALKDCRLVKLQHPCVH